MKAILHIPTMAKCNTRDFVPGNWSKGYRYSYISRSDYASIRTRAFTTDCLCSAYLEY